MEKTEFISEIGIKICEYIAKYNENPTRIYLGFYEVRLIEELLVSTFGMLTVEDSGCRFCIRGLKIYGVGEEKHFFIA